jgi:hypothetical protein
LGRKLRKCDKEIGIKRQYDISTKLNCRKSVYCHVIECAIDLVLDSILNLLTTYIHDSALQAITEPQFANDYSTR